PRRAPPPFLGGGGGGWARGGWRPGPRVRPRRTRGRARPQPPLGGAGARRGRGTVLRTSAVVLDLFACPELMPHRSTCKGYFLTNPYALPAARPTPLRSDSTLHPGTISARPDRRPDSPPPHESWQKSTLDTTP